MDNEQLKKLQAKADNITGLLTFALGTFELSKHQYVEIYEKIIGLLLDVEPIENTDEITKRIELEIKRVHNRLLYTAEKFKGLAKACEELANQVEEIID